MASAPDLRWRIRELASAIKVHKDAIRELERTKSEVEGDLNAILDPIGRLPLEISSDIFLRCLPSNPTCDIHDAPLVFMRVCHSWSTIALSTPSLWTIISFESPCRKGALKLCDDWLNRSKALPLSLSINGSLNEKAGALVGQHAGRLQKLNLALLSGQELRPLLKMQFASLTSLTIGQGKVDPGPQRYREGGNSRCYYSWTLDECVEILYTAPNLVECAFEGLDFPHYAFRYDMFPTDFEFYTHTTLKSLRLGTDDLESHSSSSILQYITLPALETLTVSYLDMPPSDLIAFLTRSLGLLRTFNMTIYRWESMWPMEAMDAFFRVFPTLTHLNLQFDGNDSDNLFFEFLVIRSLRELPNLRDLQIRGCPPLARPQYEELVSALAAHKKLRSFRLVWTHGDHTPDPDILVFLRAISENGVEIYAGAAEGSNLIYDPNHP